ncbi:MAG: DUF4294 domain-containing protein [Bacteroidota bacterium]
MQFKFDTYRQWVLCLGLLITAAFASGQSEVDLDSLIDGEIVRGVVYEGDTLMFANLGMASVKARLFEDDEEWDYYKKTRRRANKVYPYAVKALEVFRKIEDFSKDAKKRQRKKYIKSLQKELKSEFEDPLRNLSKSQGKVLVEMIERELYISMFKLIKELKGGFKANTWTFAGKFLGYKLKKPYDPEDDPILELVLSRFDLSQAGK